MVLLEVTLEEDEFNEAFPIVDFERNTLVLLARETTNCNLVV